jgi:hypothetical protein
LIEDLVDILVDIKASHARTNDASEEKKYGIKENIVFDCHHSHMHTIPRLA